jgi:transketolase
VKLSQPSPDLRSRDGGNLDARGVAHRREILRIIEKSRRGHVGAALSAMEIVRVLYDDILRVDPANPRWPDRDRFVFSKGHGCLALYIMLAEKGFFPREELDRVCQFEAMLGGHPESRKIPGVEASTGSLGHGLSIGVGCALAARIDKKDYRTFVLIGDGEANEGSVWEAALSAGRHKLRNLTVIVDFNRMHSYGPATDTQDVEPLADKLRSFNFAVRETDGHDVDALRHAFESLPHDVVKPSALICYTVKGKGIPSAEWSPDWHHKAAIAPQELAALYREIDGKS